MASGDVQTQRLPVLDIVISDLGSIFYLDIIMLGDVRDGQSFHSNAFSLSSDSILLFNTNIISPKGVSTTCVTYKYIFGDEMFLVPRNFFRCVRLC